MVKMKISTKKTTSCINFFKKTALIALGAVFISCSFKSYDTIQKLDFEIKSKTSARLEGLFDEFDKYKKNDDVISQIIICKDIATILDMESNSDDPVIKNIASKYYPDAVNNCGFFDFRLLNIIENAMQSNSKEIRINSSKSIPILVFHLKTSFPDSEICFWSNLFLSNPNYFKPNKIRFGFNQKDSIYKIFSILSIASNDQTIEVRDNLNEAIRILFNSNPNSILKD